MVLTVFSITKDTKDFSYSEFSDAIRKDLLENYNFDYVKNSFPIGSVEYYYNGDKYIGLDMSIYENYTNTIEYLKKCDIYVDYVLDVDDINKNS